MTKKYLATLHPAKEDNGATIPRVVVVKMLEDAIAEMDRQTGARDWRAINVTIALEVEEREAALA